MNVNWQTGHRRKNTSEQHSRPKKMKQLLEGNPTKEANLDEVHKISEWYRIQPMEGIDMLHGKDGIGVSDPIELVVQQVD